VTGPVRRGLSGTKFTFRWVVQKICHKLYWTQLYMEHEMCFDCFIRSIRSLSSQQHHHHSIIEKPQPGTNGILEVSSVLPGESFLFLLIPWDSLFSRMGCILSKHSIHTDGRMHPEKVQVKEATKYKNPTRAQVPSPSRASISSLPPWVNRHDRVHSKDINGLAPS